MINWKPHRLWAGILGAAILIGLFNGPVLGAAQKKARADLASLQREHAKAALAVKQLREDIAETESLKNQIGATSVEKFLAPANRLRVAQIMERRASEARLSHFSYTLAPEQKIQMDTLGSGKQMLARSKITLTADAPTDNDAYLFVDNLRRALPGQFQVRSFSLQRIGPQDAPVGVANLRLAASGDWLSNGASRKWAGDEP
ncbi:MAG: hypothetical protein P4M15_13260 [Alphaproteobacteria bacterium]|nr:hypothetical protein [Alphaproteobacteria bacterium]